MMRFKGSGSLWSPHHPGGESIEYQSGLSVQIYSYLEGYSSIANIARSWTRVLADKIDSIGLHNYAEGSADLDGIPEKLFRFDPYARIAIYYGMPADIPPMLCSNHEIKIGAFVCETDRVPNAWVDVANRFDLIVVPSRFSQQAYSLSGVKVPIIVIPHGVEEDYRPRKIRRKSDKFVFYNTFSAASFPARKGCEELIRCFTKAFHGRDDVVLILRTHNAGKIKEWRDYYDKSGLVKIMPYEACSTDEYASLFSRADCTVHPSRGEGFGMVPLQSIACETPVIAMPVTGMADYLSKDNAMLLRDTGKISGKGWGGQSGNYFGVDEDHLVELLHYAVNNKDVEKEKASIAGAEVRVRYSWDSVLSPLLEIVEDICREEDTSKSKQRLNERLREMDFVGECGFSNVSALSSQNVLKAQLAVDDILKHTYCITTERYRHRWSAAEAQWKEFNIPGKFFMGVDLTKTSFPARIKADGQPLTPHAQAIITNHLDVIRMARDKGMPQVVVFEDDFVFSDEFKDFEKYLNHVPDDWDVIMLGGSWRIKDSTPVDDVVVRMRRSWNAHAYIVRQQFYDKFIEFQSPMEWETDVYNGQMQDKKIGNWYGFYKDLCWQRGLDGGSVTMSVLHPEQVENFGHLMSDNEVGFRFWWRHGGHLIENYMRAFGDYQIDNSVPDQMSTIKNK